MAIDFSERRLAILEKRIDDLERERSDHDGVVLRELGKLTKNDEVQNIKIEKLENHMQELLSLKISIEANFRLLKFLVVAVPAAIGAITWAFMHVKP